MTDDRTPHRPPDASAGDDALDALLAAARDEAPPPLSPALRARLVADARAHAPVAAPPAPGWFARLRAALAEIGGAPGLAGVGVAGLAGVWIGFSGPGVTGEWLDRFWLGAADVSPTVAALIDVDALAGEAGDLPALLAGDLE